MIPQSKFPPLTTTGSVPVNILQWVKEKNVVALLHTLNVPKVKAVSEENAADLLKSVFMRVFHALPETPQSLEDVRVIYVNCNELPDLIEDMESEIMALEDAKELDDNSEIKKTIQLWGDVPHKAQFKIPQLSSYGIHVI